MEQDQLVIVVSKVFTVLNEVKIPYMLVGSLSLNLYAVPRHTHDADIVVQLNDIPLSRIASKLGSDFKLQQQIAFETVTSTTLYKMTHASGFVIEFFELSNDPHDQERFARRKTTTLAGVEVSVPTAEDVVIQKVRWAAKSRRAKDLADSENIISVQKSTLDLAYIRRWCDLHGTRGLFEELLKNAV